MARNKEPSWVNSLLIYDRYPITHKFTISIFSSRGFFAQNFSNFLFCLNWATKGFHVFPLTHACPCILFSYTGKHQVPNKKSTFSPVGKTLPSLRKKTVPAVTFLPSTVILDCISAYKYYFSTKNLPFWLPIFPLLLPICLLFSNTCTILCLKISLSICSWTHTSQDFTTPFHALGAAYFIYSHLNKRFLQFGKSSIHW